MAERRQADRARPAAGQPLARCCASCTSTAPSAVRSWAGPPGLSSGSDQQRRRRTHRGRPASRRPGCVDSDGGRPRTLLRVAPGQRPPDRRRRRRDPRAVELFDLALTELAATDRPLADSGHDVDRRRPAHPRRRRRRARRAPASTPSALLGVGIGVPGIVEQRAGGAARSCTARPSAGTPSRSSSCCAPPALPTLPLFIDNGAKTLGQAEMWFGARPRRPQRGDRAVRLRGRRLRGRRRHAVPRAPAAARASGATPTVRVGGRRCRCGARGCLEAYVGRRGAARPLAGGAAADRGVERGDRARRAAAPPPTAAEPEPPARAVLDETAEYLGAGIADLINLFNPERIVHRRLGRAAARPAAAARRPRGRRRVRAAPPRRADLHRAGPARRRTRSPSAPPPCRWPASWTPAASAPGGGAEPDRGRGGRPLRNRTARAVRCGTDSRTGRATLTRRSGPNRAPCPPPACTRSFRGAPP